jgi:hypothetical protein
MAHKLKTVGLIGALLSLLGLIGCNSPASTSMPTQDPNPIRTEAAATVLAQVSQTLAAQPSDTPVPTFTATPTLVPVISTATATASATPVVTITLPGGTPAVVTVDLAEWVSQSIADDTIFAPGEVFTMTWTMKNVGSSTWAVGYMLRFYSGNQFGALSEVLLDREVLPGETVDITIQMKAPAVPGNYRSDWVMATEKRSNFKEPVFLKISVVAPPTATRTPTLTPSP